MFKDFTVLFLFFFNLSDELKWFGTEEGEMAYCETADL